MDVMKNKITIEEIKESVEYNWRKNQIIILLYAWLLVAGVSLLVPFAVSIDSIELIGMGFLIWLFWMLFIGLFIFVAILFYLNKNRYLLNNYQNFNAYEVVLDRFSTSYAYRGAIYYTVNILDNGVRKNVDTNPYFSNYLFSKFIPQDYNNKKVIGLYDSHKEKFYIIKKVN